MSEVTSPITACDANAEARPEQADRRRVSISLSANSLDRLERLKTATDISSTNELVRRGLRMLEFMADLHQRDAKFFVEEKDGASRFAVRMPLAGK